MEVKRKPFLSRKDHWQIVYIVFDHGTSGLDGELFQQDIAEKFQV